MPNQINMKGTIIVNIFGIKYRDNNKTSKTSMCKKFVIVNSLVICNIHATDRNMNKIKMKCFIICKNK